MPVIDTIQELRLSFKFDSHLLLNMVSIKNSNFNVITLFYAKRNIVVEIIYTFELMYMQNEIVNVK